MRKILVLSLLASFVLVSCSTDKRRISNSGKKVSVLTNRPGSECVIIAKVVGENDEGSVEMARAHARNLVADKDGNAVFFDEEVPNGKNYKVYASGYECN